MLLTLLLDFVVATREAASYICAIQVLLVTELFVEFI